MPEVDQRAVLQLALLLLVVPCQFMLSRYMSTPSNQRNSAFQNLMSSAANIKNKYMSLEYWQKLCVDLLSQVNLGPGSHEASDDPSEDDQGESPAVEVARYEDPSGYFATSTEPRIPRPAHVKYRIGQVIEHKLWGYRGIIVGWDEKAKAPDWWIKDMHGKNKHWSSMPNYSVLVDTRDRLTPQKTYVAEDNIKIVTNTRVIHPEVDDYFETFDGAQYLPRPWLRSIYPHD